MKYYAYIPRKDGSEPLGTFGRIMFEADDAAAAISEARDYLQNEKNFAERGMVVQSYTNFYNEQTFRPVYKGK